MKPIDEIPETILDLLGTIDFDTLSKEQQSRVLLYLTEKEYRSMHRTTQLLHSTHLPGDTAVSLKPRLLERFKHRHQTLPLWKKSIQVWQVAAMLVAIGGLWLFSHYRIHPTSPLTIVQNDTVYLEKEVKVTDTVYLTKQVTEQTDGQPQASRPNKTRRLKPYQNADIYFTNGIHQRSLKEVEEPQNTIKGNSIKDDPLLQTIGFVTL